MGIGSKEMTNVQWSILLNQGPNKRTKGLLPLLEQPNILRRIFVKCRRLLAFGPSLNEGFCLPRDDRSLKAGIPPRTPTVDGVAVIQWRA